MIECAEALSTAPITDSACDEVVAKLRSGLGGSSSDLTMIFATIHHVEALDKLARTLREDGLGRVVLGCTCESIVGEGQEIEASPALAVWSAQLPGVELTPFHVEGDAGWPDPANADPANAVLLLADPFRFPIDNFLHRVAAEKPGTRFVGGMASGGSSPGQNRLVLGDVAYTEGAVGVVIRGDVSIRAVVSQGCRPIGRPMIVTKAEKHIIRELGRRPALEVVQELFGELTEEDQELVKSGLHIGRVINEYQDSFGRGDFLVRNVMGADQTGGIAISDLVRVGQTVQFQVRDADTADEDLRDLIALAKSDGPVAGALIFTCNGRGSRLFLEPHHDVKVIRELLGPIPATGFFAMGELGPVGGQNFIHGFTASVVLFGM